MDNVSMTGHFPDLGQAIKFKSGGAKRALSLCRTNDTGTYIYLFYGYKENWFPQTQRFNQI